jgi:molecular chaperone DnaK (HSP70)
MPRYLVVLAFVASFAGASLAASAADPSPASGDADAAVDRGQVRAKNAGTIEGQVVAVDYRTGTIAVQAGSRRLEIVVLPSTNIVGSDKFHTIADIQKGSRVSVLLSQRAGTYSAQIIRLR